MFATPGVQNKARDLTMAKASVYYFKMVVGDCEKLARFYCDVFGMTEAARYDALNDDDPHL